MRKLLFFTFLIPCFAIAQVKDSLRYREDQFYIDLNLALQVNDINNFQQKGFSRSFHMGFLRDLPLTVKGDKALALGIGYGHVRLVNNINVEKSLAGYSYTLPVAARALRNVFSYHQLQFPIELRWRTSNLKKYAFWRVYLGYRLSHQFGAKYKPFFGRKIDLNNQLNPWQHSMGIALGFNTWNLRFDYTFTPLLRQEIRSISGSSFKINPLQVGLIFYLL
ncbi:MAG: outer membrane beta-barrel protein [Flavobacteriaceae bacterium]